MNNKQLAVPDGYVLVPIEPTKAMQNAWDCAGHSEDGDEEFRMAYREMIAASPAADCAAAPVEIPPSAHDWLTGHKAAASRDWMAGWDACRDMSLAAPSSQPAETPQRKMAVDKANPERARLCATCVHKDVAGDAWPCRGCWNPLGDMYAPIGMSLHSSSQPADMSTQATYPENVSQNSGEIDISQPAEPVAQPDLRFIQRVLESDAPKQDRDAAAAMVRELRRLAMAKFNAEPVAQASQQPPTDKAIDDRAFELGIQSYAYVDDPSGYRSLVRSFTSRPAAEPVAQAEQQPSDDQRMTIGDAAKSVGAWEEGGPGGYVCFGSWMAVHAFVLKIQAPLVSALRDVAFSKPLTATPQQMLRAVQGMAKEALSEPVAQTESEQEAFEADMKRIGMRVCKSDFGYYPATAEMFTVWQAARRPERELTDAEILLLICDHTGKRINLCNFTLDELKVFARALLAKAKESK